MAEVEISHATCVYPGASRPSVDDASLTVGDGEFLTLLGRAGTGKSTLLRMLAGLEETTSGVISIGGRDVTRLPPKHRNVAMVFQNYALYPQMSVFDNMEFALRVAGVPKIERERRVMMAAEDLSLTDLLPARPSELSGRQRQRIAIGRAIVRQPDALLFDEPFAGLPLAERSILRTQVMQATEDHAITTVYATREPGELPPGDRRVAVMGAGNVEQVGSVPELRARPATVNVASVSFAPSLCIVDQPIEDGVIRVGEERLEVPGTSDPRVWLAFPSAAASITHAPGAIRGVVEHASLDADGSSQDLTIRVAGARRLFQLEVTSFDERRGDAVGIAVDLNRSWVFSRSSGLLLRAPSTTTSGRGPRRLRSRR